MATTTLIPHPLEVGRLASEVERYLAAVEAFREDGYEPRWAPEWIAASAAAPSLSRSDRREER